MSEIDYLVIILGRFSNFTTKPLLNSLSINEKAEGLIAEFIVLQDGVEFNDADFHINNKQYLRELKLLVWIKENIDWQELNNRLGYNVNLPLSDWGKECNQN